MVEELEHRAKQLLSSPTPWNELYFRLSASDLKDDRWNSRNFGKQRVSDVQAALKFLEKHDATKYNVQSIATGKLGTMVAGMMAGKQSRAKPSDFLPFDTSKIQKDDGLTESSMIVLNRLLKTKRIHGRLLGMLAEEIKRASSR